MELRSPARRASRPAAPLGRRTAIAIRHLRDRRSGCPIAATLDLVGDRWTLVILRDMITGKKRFAEFLDSPERIATNVLTDRLAAMEASGLVERQAYQARPKRYEYLLTKKGRDLHPALCEICRWANRHYPDTWIPPKSFMTTTRRRAPA